VVGWVERKRTTDRAQLFFVQGFGHATMRNSGSGSFGTLLQRVVIGFAAVGTLLGVTIVVAVYRIMSNFHDELLRRPGAAHDPVLLDAIASESNTTILILATIILVAALNIAAGFAMLMRSAPERSD
jgi:ABC-type lipoprotein release transport system permease subunit